MKQKLFIALLLGLLTVSAFTAQTKEEKEAQKKAQKELKSEMGKDLFDPVYSTFSPDKPSIVTLKDGRTVKGKRKGIKQKKGQIFPITIQDSLTKKKETFAADKISEMYLYPGSVEKGDKMHSYFGKVNNYGRKNLSKIVSQGYIYFKNQEVSLKNKKKKTEYLMQLINPEFSKYIEVYGDPIAKETTGFSFGGRAPEMGGMSRIGGGPQIGGGVTKSYYIKKGDKIFWLHKDDFKEQYEEIFGDNADFIAKHPYKSVKWVNLSYLVLEYTKTKN